MNYFCAPLKWLLRTAIAFYVLIFVSSAYASEALNNIGLIAGAKTGTYIRIANDIAVLAKASGLDVTVHESNGSLENIAAVFERPDIQLGLVQSDVLGYLQESQNRKLERVAQQVVMMLPLYNEEVHLLGKKDIL